MIQGIEMAMNVSLIPLYDVYQREEQLKSRPDILLEAKEILEKLSRESDTCH